MSFILKILISGMIISVSSWLAGKKPGLAGFLLALPISSMLAIAFAQTEWKDAEKSVTFAKSIFLGVPLSLTFFLPFLLAKYLKWPFWGTYCAGVLCLAVSYGIHQAIFPD